MRFQLTHDIMTKRHYPNMKRKKSAFNRGIDNPSTLYKRLKKN